MADPFEVRMRFTHQLQTLNASITSAQKTASYALKHRDLDEDLHSCILEQLERNSMNNRANIFYFFEALCDRARYEGHMEYVRMMERDILRIIDLVAPEDEGGKKGAGAANVKVVRRVLASLRQKGYLNPKTVEELEECIKDRDQVAPFAATHQGRPDRRDDDDEFPGDAADPALQGGPVGANVRVDKRQIEQRIEEDRERHKRLRENIWAVSGEGDDEYQRMLEETSDAGSDDYRTAAEEADERRRCAETHRLEYLEH